MRLSGIFTTSDPHRRSAHRLAMSYVDRNYPKFEAYYGKLIERTLLSPIFRWMLLMEIIVATYLSSLKTGLWYHNLIHIPAYCILLFYPLIKRLWFKGREYWILILLVYLLTIEWSLSAHLYYISGAWSKFPKEVGTLVMALIWLLVAAPRALQRVFAASGASFLFIGLLGIIAPEILKENAISLQMGACLGLAVNTIISIVIRYNFFFIEQERNIRDKSEEISRILESVKHGIFQIHIDKAGILRIGGRTSPHFIALFGDLKSNLFTEVFLDRLIVDAEKKSMIESSLRCIVGEDRLNFEFNESVLPAEVILKRGEEERIIECVWTPMWNPEFPQLVDAILVSTTDITLQRKLANEARNLARNSSIIMEVVVLGRFKAIHLMEGLQNLANKMHIDLASFPEVLHQDHQDRLLRVLHTLKGCARTANFQILAVEINLVEQNLNAFKKSASHMTKSLVQAEIRKVSDNLSEYDRVYTSLEWVRTRNLLEIPSDLVKAIVEESDLLKRLEARGEILAELENFLKPVAKRFSRVIHENFEGSLLIAKRLGKLTPNLQIEGDAWLKESAIQVFDMLLPHLYANSMDHGIESPEERVDSRKRPEGCITTVLEPKGGFFEFRFWDDGRGVDPDSIYQKALSEKIIPEGLRLTPEEKVKLIFHAGFSTKSIATEISGRGVGLSAVMDHIHAIGGQVQVVLGQSKGGRQSMQLCFRIPSACMYDIVPDHANHPPLLAG